MKKVIEKEATLCDLCQRDCGYAYTCKECGLDVCSDCKDDNIKKYAHAVHFTGSGDGYYCTKCEQKLKESGKNDLFNAYLDIQKLRVEEKKFYKEFKAKTDWGELQVQIALGR